MNFASYDTAEFYDEMFTARRLCPLRRAAAQRADRVAADGELQRRQKAAERLLLQIGITFNVYGDDAGTEKIFPFDIVPRIVEAAEWDWIERGLKQRIHALNLFIDDIYHEQKIVRDDVVPEHLICSASSFREAVRRAQAAAGHLVPHHRHRPGARQRRPVLRAGRQPALSLRRVVRAARTASDEADVPAGVRGVARPARGRLSQPPARHAAIALAPTACESPTVARADAGHLQLGLLRALFLAQQMGVELVEGRDLVVDGRLRLHAHHQGLRAGRCDLSPHRRRLPRPAGVPRRLDAGRARADGRLSGRPCRAGQRAGHRHRRRQSRLRLRAEIIKYYLGEDAIIPNVPTYVCCDDDDRSTCWRTSTSWSSSRPTNRAATAC